MSSADHGFVELTAKLEIIKRLFSVRRQLVQQHSEREYVDLLVVNDVTAHNLRGPVPGRAFRGDKSARRSVATASEVGDLCVDEGAKGKGEDENVVRFEVAVNDGVAVKERQAF